MAWLLVQIADTVFEAFELGEAPLRYVILAASVGLVPALVLSWFFEFSGHGISREVDVDHSSTQASRNSSHTDRVIVALLLVALAYFVVDKFILQAKVDNAVAQKSRIELINQQFGDRSIAVLPFSNTSSDPEQAYFADGLSEQLLNVLAQIPELKVISRTSSFVFKDKTGFSSREIAEQLGVVYLLEGSVRSAGNMIRVSTQLIDTRNDAQVWSASFDRTLDDVFAIQDDVANQVATQLRLQILDGRRTVDTTDPRAYMLFSRARQLLDDSSNDYDRAFALLEQALEIDPDYADAYTAVAWVYFRYRMAENPEKYAVFKDITLEESDVLHRHFVQRALELDPHNAIANAYVGWNIAFLDNNLLAAAPYYENALRLGPEKPDVVRTTLLYANALRRPEAAIEIGEYGLVRDPLCDRCKYNLMQTYMMAEQYAEAEFLARSIVAEGKGGHHTLGRVLLMQGKAREALDQFELFAQRVASLDSEMDHQVFNKALLLQGRVMALFSLGRSAESDALMSELTRDYIEPVPFAVLTAYAWRGEFKEAMQLLDTIIDEENEESVVRHLLLEPEFRPLWSQPRVAALIRKHGMSREQLDEIKLDFSLPGTIPFSE